MASPVWITTPLGDTALCCRIELGKSVDNTNLKLHCIDGSIVEISYHKPRGEVVSLKYEQLTRLRDTIVEQINYPECECIDLRRDPYSKILSEEAEASAI